MRLLSLLLLIALANAAPTKDDDKIIENPTPNQKIFNYMLLFYTAEHDVVNMIFPLNSLNFDMVHGVHDNSNNESSKYLFFVQADIKNGVKDYKGLYVLKNNIATKLLENGRDATASNDMKQIYRLHSFGVDNNKTFKKTENVYFGATDGLYSYDVENNKAIKYGTVTDSIIGLDKASDSDVIYILTEDKELFKVTEEGTKKEKVDDIKSAEQFVLDTSNNLYYYSNDKKPYVKGVEGVKMIEGLPENPTEVILLRPPLVIEGGVSFVVDNVSYLIFSNGTSQLFDLKFKGEPSAYSLEGSSPSYFAYGKNIYEFSIQAVFLIGLMEELQSINH